MGSGDHSRSIEFCLRLVVREWIIMKICYVTDITSWRPIEFLNQLSQLDDISFEGIYYRVSSNIAHLIQHSYLNLNSPAIFSRNDYISLEVMKKVFALKPDIVVFAGYSMLVNQLLAFELTKNKIPWVSWAERPGKVPSPIRGLVRNVLMWQTLNRSSGIFATGFLAQQKYLALVKPGIPVINVPYFINLSNFLDINRNKNSTAKKRLAFLYVGKLIRLKKIEVLIRSFINLAPIHQNIYLHIVGDGPDRPFLEKISGEYLHSKRIIFHGFKEWANLPRFYLNGDVFCFPSSHDGWGLVVNEAMASGMPVITMDSVGAALDLIEDNGTGYIVPEGNIEEFQAAMEYFILNPDEIYRMGNNARNKILNYDIGAGAIKFYHACKLILEKQ